MVIVVCPFPSVYLLVSNYSPLARRGFDDVWDALASTGVLVPALACVHGAGASVKETIVKEKTISRESCMWLPKESSRVTLGLGAEIQTL